MAQNVHDDIALSDGPLSVGYCRGCGAWRVSCTGYEERATGNGLDAYRQFIDICAGRNCRWDSDFLRALGGHETEVAA